MNMKQLIELLGENSQAVDFVTKLEQDTNNNVGKINDLERRIADISETRDKFKSGNSLVKELLGLEQVNEDTIKDFLSSQKGSKPDEKLLAEVDNLKGLLKKTDGEKESLENEFKAKIQKMGLDNEIANSGVGALFANEAMYQLGLNLIKDGASFEDGKVIYKNNDGTTAYNGSNPTGIQDKIESLKSNVSYAGLFNPDVKAQGGGTPPPNQSTNTPKRGEMSHAQKGEYISTHGQKAYLSLDK